MLKYPPALAYAEHWRAGVQHDIGNRGVKFMVTVRRMPGDSDDTLIRKFQRKVLNEGIIPEAKRRAFYLKPSLARKQKIQDNRRAKKMWV